MDVDVKGVILAGGLGTRLNPLTEITNKHMLPVGTEPMIWHAVRQLMSAGVTDLLVVTSVQHMGALVNSLGSGGRFGCAFTYRVQQEAGGIAHALSLARGFANGSRLVVLLGDNIFEYSIASYVEDFRSQARGARVLLKDVAEPERFGIATLDEGRILEIEEKPVCPKSNYAVVGCYMYDPTVFDLIDRIDKSDRGEMEITSVNSLYLERGELEYSIVRGGWTDAGTFDSLHEANALLLATGNRPLD